VSGKRDKTNPTRILVADDDEQVRSLFVKKLAAAGYEVHAARTGQRALDMLKASRFDLLVLDLNMPGTDGFEVLKTTRAEQPHVRVLVISGYMKGALLSAAEWFGAADTLDKTLAPEQLVGHVKRLLGDV
jgi:CheY-like chemotaxis protein